MIATLLKEKMATRYQDQDQDQHWARDKDRYWDGDRDQYQDQWTRTGTRTGTRTQTGTRPGTRTRTLMTLEAPRKFFQKPQKNSMRCRNFLRRHRILLLVSTLLGIALFLITTWL